MNQSGFSLQRFLSELQRRRVLRVAAVYAAAAWVVVEVSDTIAPLLRLPDWTPALVLVLVLLGFPVVIALAWTFDITSGGLERTDPRAHASAGGSVEGEEPAAVPATAESRRSWSAGRIAVVGAVVILALAAVAMYRARGTDGPATIGNRVAVVPFENHTGDPELDDLGLVAADWISDGLTAIDSVQVVPAAEVRQVMAEAGEASPLAWLAGRTRAGLSVTGSYVVIGDSVQVRAQLVDPGESRVLVSFEPARSHRSDPTASLAPTRERVMTAVALRLRANSAEWLAAVGARPPSYEAYRAYLIGMELYRAGRFAQAIREFDRAREMDSTFWTPLFFAAGSFGELGQPAKQDSVHRLMEPHRSELSDVERIWLDWQSATLRGDLAAAHRAARRAYERAPGSMSRNIAAWTALSLNRPHEAVTLLREEPAASGFRASWLFFHSVLAGALHLLGEHRQELEAAREARTLFSDHPHPLYLEARALTALGRPDEAEALVDDLLPVSPSPASAASSMRHIGDVLDAHGHPEAAQRVYARTLEALQEQGPPESPAQKVRRAEVLQRLGRPDEAAEHAAAAHAADPGSRAAQALVGLIAAQRGDRAAAERIEAELAAREDPYDRGGNTYYRACIRARLGDLDRAVELLRQAHAQGQPIHDWIRTDPDLRRLRGHAGYEELIRLKG